MRNILEKHSLPNFDTLTSKEREKYHNEYSDEISKEYTRLV
jgi:hypothetical protein